MSAVERAAARRVAAASERLADRLGDRLGGMLPVATVTPIAGGVAVTGVGLRHHRLTEPALRWPAGLLR